MRRCMFMLAVCGFFAGPLSAAEDPFDFSSPLNNSTGRTAQYFSRAQAQADSAPSTDGTETSAAYRRKPRSSAGHLLDDPQRTAPTDPQPSVQFDQQAASSINSSVPTESSDTSRRDPQEALRRFDEFLKSRDVVSAEYSERTSESQESPIRQVQFQDDLPAFGDLDGNPPAKTSAPQSKETIQGLLFGDEPVSRGDALTNPISTAPADAAALPAIKVDRPTTATVTVVPEKQPAEHTLEANNFDTLATSPAAGIAISNSKSETEPAAISTVWKLLDPLNVGQQCRAELVVTNTGSTSAERVSLEVRIPESVQVVRANPPPVEQVQFLGWKIPSLAGGKSTTIQVVLMTTQSGPLDLATYVRHTSAHHQAYTVSEPKLELVMSGPQEVHVGEPASQTLVVKNPGTGTATNVTIDAKIPTGLEHATGEHLQMDIGSLNPGEVRSVRLVMAAVAGGSQIVQVEARADSGILRTAAAEVTVIAPSLRTGIVGPSLRYLGREAEYTVRVLNDGSAATDFVQVNHRIPEGFDFVRADRGAKFDSNTRVLNWYVGRLESGESLDLNLALLPTAAGEFTHQIRATSELGAQADAQMTTKVQGAASLVVKVADLDDPVEVGTETAYEITVTNEGTATARDVGLTCEVPQGLAILKADGPSEHKLQNAMIGFRPVPELAAGKSLTYRVFVKGGLAGDQRFRCRLTSEALKQPLFTEELTKFYSE